MVTGREPGHWYEIRVEGRLDERWAARLPGFEIHPTDRDQTALVAYITDQAALFGALRLIRDLAIPLVLVRRLDGDEP